MSYAFTFPTFDQWALCTLQISHAFGINTLYYTWSTWWKLDGSVAGGATPLSLLRTGFADKVFNIASNILAGNCASNANVVIKSDGLYYSRWISNSGTTPTVATSLITDRSSVCIRKYIGANGDQYAGRSYLPFPPVAALADDTSWNVLYRAAWLVMKSQLLGGFVSDGLTFRPMLFRPTTQTWDYITNYGIGQYPLTLYRRRLRAWKHSPAILPMYPSTFASPTFSWP